MTRRLGVASSLVGVACLLVGGLLTPLDNVSVEAHRALGLALFAVILWTAEPVPVEYTSLVVLVLFPTLGLLSVQQAFAPIATPTIWLVFAGMVLSASLQESGLGAHMATAAAGYLGRSKWRLMVGLNALGLGAAFLVPSGVVRVLLLMPIGMAIVDRLGRRHDVNTNATVLLSLLCSTYYGGGGILTGSVPNMVVAGQLEWAHGEVIFWSHWLLWMFPVIGLVRTLLCMTVVWYLFGRRMEPLPALRPASSPTIANLDGIQKKGLGILLLGTILWASDAVHGLAPVYVGLVLVLLCLAPRWGPLSMQQLREVNFAFFFYLAALFSIGTVLDSTGVNDAVIDYLLGWIDIASYGWLGKHLAITALVVPLDFLMDIAAVGAVTTPSMVQLGELHGIAHTPAALCVAMATSLVFLPYQSAPFMVALTFRRFSMGQLIACMMLISVLSLLSLCPLNVLYWRWAGLI